jgi:hypothetical protein
VENGKAEQEMKNKVKEKEGKKKMMQVKSRGTRKSMAQKTMRGVKGLFQASNYHGGVSTDYSKTA